MEPRRAARPPGAWVCVPTSHSFPPSLIISARLPYSEPGLAKHGICKLAPVVAVAPKGTFHTGQSFPLRCLAVSFALSNGRHLLICTFGVR